jgi:ABC-type transporter Mla subunit MlaD
MGYRGEDLDLRTPQSMGAGSGSRADMSFDQYDGPIWVDDLVLACCNHAYDVALAHRSAEVRLEHLLHAMTRVDGAARILESHGVRENALRRESATVIASDIPVGLPNGKGHPRRSEDFERVLRLASQTAGRNNVPATVQDLLHVMLEVEPNLPGLQLLHQHTGSQGGYSDPQGYRMEPRYASYEPPPVDRVRMVPAYYVENGGRQMMPESNNPTDHLQNSRLDALEKMVRGLGQDLASEHKTLNGVLTTLQSDMRAQRDGIDQVSGRLGENGGQSMDRLENQLVTLAKTTSEVTQRLEQFERSLQTRLDVVETALQATGGGELADLSPLANRLGSIEEALLKRGDGGGVSSDQLKTFVAPITERLSSLQNGLEQRQSLAADALQGLSDRIADMERLMGEGGSVSNGHGRYDDDLSEVHEALMKLNSNQHTLAEAINSWRSDSGSSSGGLDGRLASLESLAENMERLHKVTVERYHRRNRLWYWLFGTDDWIAASWPSQAARVEEELRAFQCGLRDSRA